MLVMMNCFVNLENGDREKDSEGCDRNIKKRDGKEDEDEEWKQKDAYKEEDKDEGD